MSSTPFPSSTRWLAVLLIWCAGFAAAAQFAKISVSFDLLEAIYPEAALGIPVILSILGIFGLIGGATAGIVISRFGPARLLIAALAFGAVLSALQAFLPPYPVLLALRLIEGLSHIVLVVAGPTLMVAVSAPRDHRTVMAIWATFFGVGFALTAWLGFPLAQSQGVSALFQAHALALLILAVALRLVGLPRLPRASAPSQGWIATHLAIYRNLPTALPGMVFLWHTITYVALLTLLPALGPAGTQGLLGTLLPLTGLVGTFTAMALIRRHGSLPGIAITGFAGTALLVLLLTQLQGTSAFVPVAALLSFFAGLVPGAAFAMVPAFNGDAIAQSRANGALAQLGNLGTVSGTPILAFALASAGIFGLALVALCFAALGISVTLIGTRRARLEPGPPST